MGIPRTLDERNYHGLEQLRESHRAFQADVERRLLKIESRLGCLLMTDSDKLEYLKPLEDDIPVRHYGVEKGAK
jgi:hypothetical protein